MPTKDTKATDNETAIRRLIEEAWNQGNLGAVEELVARHVP